MADPIKALRRIQYEAVSLADAQVIAMEALAAQEQAEPVKHEPDFINIIAAAWFSHPAAQPESAPDNADSALLARMTSAKPLAAPARLIGWRTENYLHETADPAKAKNWEPNIGVLPIFEGDPNTKLAAPADPAAPAQPQVQAQPLTDGMRIDWLCEIAQQTCGQWQVVIESDNPSFIDALDAEAMRAHGIGQPAAGQEGGAA